MISSRDSVMWKEICPMEEEIAQGHIYVEENLPPGDYFLEGYTQNSFLRKDTMQIIAKRKVKILRSINLQRQQSQREDSTFRFELFPEGGDLIANIPAVVAFKATNGKGVPQEVEGTLYKNEKPIVQLKSLHQGMGRILFTPSPQSQYRIELTNGKNYSLPEILPQGMSLRVVKQNNKEITLLISQTKGMPSQSIQVVCQLRGMVCAVAKGRLKESLKISISVERFPYQGVAEITLLNQQEKPVAERLVYVHPQKRLKISMEMDKEIYTIRQRATMKIKVTDEKGKPLRTNLEISVYNHAYQNQEDPINILSYCYLSAQIRGKIHNPAYYFEKEDEKRKIALDLLLLTQGWRRYIWSMSDKPYLGEKFLPDGITGRHTIERKKEQNNG
ncbi:MAG: hypothetical protein LUD15_15040 [Bacteroides sp.]|nr:hypothetical protein [Bacteroides sp.]